MKTEEYYKNLGQVVISKEELQAKIKELAGQISNDYKGREVVLVCNLKGSFRFLADLVSYLSIPALVDFVSFRSYSGSTSEGKIRIEKDLTIDVTDKEVLIIEDIIDAGITLNYLMEYIEEFKKPKGMKVCVLLDKPVRRKMAADIRYRGFEIPDKFIVGYGLDYDEHFRELNDIREYQE